MCPLIGSKEKSSALGLAFLLIPYSNPEGNRALFNVMDSIDGTHSVAQIASKCGISFKATMNVINDLHARGLVDWETSNRN